MHSTSMTRWNGNGVTGCSLTVPCEIRAGQAHLAFSLLQDWCHPHSLLIPASGREALAHSQGTVLP